MFLGLFIINIEVQEIMQVYKNKQYPSVIFNNISLSICLAHISMNIFGLKQGISFDSKMGNIC